MRRPTRAGRRNPNPRFSGCRRRESRSPSYAREKTSRPRSKPVMRRRLRMRSPGRPLLAALPVTAVIAVAWLRFEEPLGSAPWRAAALVVLALAAAALPAWRLRGAGAVVAAIVAA